MFNQNQGFSSNFNSNSVLIKLIYANLAVFIGVKLLFLPFWLMKVDMTAAGFASNWLAVPANLEVLLYKPWTLFSYMFLEDRIHSL